MKLFATTDISASVHKAHEDFTHVVVNRGFTLHKPIIFDSRALLDLPLNQHTPFIKESASQVDKWRAKGGVLIEQSPYLGWECDVTVMVECPFEPKRLDKVMQCTQEYGVIPNPVSWAVYDEYVDLHTPITEHLEEIWRVCAGRQMSNSELADESGWPLSQVQYMKKVFNPKEHWYIQKRLAPEREEMLPAWDWLEGGCVPRSVVSEAGHRSMVEEMGRFGYVALRKLWHYPSETPNWRALRKAREAALKDLAAVRSLVDSLDDHLQT